MFRNVITAEPTLRRLRNIDRRGQLYAKSENLRLCRRPASSTAHWPAVEDVGCGATVNSLDKSKVVGYFAGATSKSEDGFLPGTIKYRRYPPKRRCLKLKESLSPYLHWNASAIFLCANAAPANKAMCLWRSRLSFFSKDFL